MTSSRPSRRGCGLASSPARLCGRIWSTPPMSCSNRLPGSAPCWPRGAIGQPARASSRGNATWHDALRRDCRHSRYAGSPKGGPAMEEQRRKRGGRSGNIRRSGPAISQMEWQPPRLTDRPTEPLPPAGVEAVHDAAMRILEEIGIDFLHEDSLRHLKAARADIRDGERRVRMGRHMVTELVARAPEPFTRTPRNPAAALTL